MHVLLPFFDDSSAIFASYISGRLRARGHIVELCEVPGKTGGLSSRQADILLENNQFEYVDDIAEYTLSREFDAVIVSRISPASGTLMNDEAYRAIRIARGRPCWIGFQAGLDFTPARGMKNRAKFDAVFFNKVSTAERFMKKYHVRFCQHISWGQPYFRIPGAWRAHVPLGSGDIVFFAQAISPKTRRGRMHMLQVMDAIARANSDRRVVIKLRHLPGENTNHLHKEVYAYPDLARDVPGGLASNVHWAAGTMSEALKTAACAITCTSTAAMDAIAAGVPTAVHTSYVENYADPLSAPMAAEFEASGIDLPLDDLLHLRLRRPDAAWMATRFRGDDLYDELEDVIARFGRR